MKNPKKQFLLRTNSSTYLKNKEKKAYKKMMKNINKILGINITYYTATLIIKEL